MIDSGYLFKHLILVGGTDFCSTSIPSVIINTQICAACQTKNNYNVKNCIECGEPLKMDKGDLGKKIQEEKTITYTRKEKIGYYLSNQYIKPQIWFLGGMIQYYIVINILLMVSNPGTGIRGYRILLLSDNVWLMMILIIILSFCIFYIDIERRGGEIYNYNNYLRKIGSYLQTLIVIEFIWAIVNATLSLFIYSTMDYFAYRDYSSFISLPVTLLIIPLVIYYMVFRNLEIDEIPEWWVDHDLRKKVVERAIDENTNVRWRAIRTIGDAPRWWIYQDMRKVMVERAIDDEDAGVRASAVWHLDTIPDWWTDQDIRKVMVGRAIDIEDTDERETAVESLGQVPHWWTYQEIRKVMIEKFAADKDRYVREEVVKLLGQVPDWWTDQDIRKVMVGRAIDDEDASIRWNAVEVLDRVPDWRIYQDIREAIIKTKEALQRAMSEKNDFKAIVSLLISIENSQIGELTGADAVRIIRDKEENWPLPAFPKVKNCFVEAYNQGFLKLYFNIPNKGDIMGKLTQRGETLVKLLRLE